MEKERGFKALAVVALLVAVVGVSVGFAAFSKTLNTTNVVATVNQTANPFNESLTWTNNSTGTTISNNDWSFEEFTIDDPGADNAYTKTFTADVTNNTNYKAYLDGVSSNSKTITCEAASGATVDSTVLSTFCGNVSVNVQFQGESDYVTLTDGTTVKYNASTALSYSASTGNRLSVPAKTSGGASTKTVKLTVNVAKGAVYPDGAVKITIPLISFSFTSIA